MKSMKNRLFRFACIFNLFIFSFTSCEVGLGNTVDTEPPELTITSPESASIIRGDFALKGSWKDDGDIDKVFCVLKNTNNEQLKYTVNGEAKKDNNGNGIWSIIVENGTVADGSYEASVSIFDKAGHETKVVRQFVIDNTAPVIILKRPSSRKGEESAENIDGYGQIFNLKGLAADDSGVGLIEVSIYSDEELTQLVKTVSIKNVPNTISLDVAEFEEGVENDYSAIYGSTNRTAGEQKRWCRVIAYDGAQNYPIDGSQQTEEDKKGNAVSSYYLYEDISSTILSQYKITDLYAMKNGSYTGDASARSASLEDLSSKEITAGVFTLNPANNPYYTVSGFQELKLDGTDFGQEMYIKNGGSLIISVKPGLDSYEILNDSLKVYIQQCDKNGNPTGSLIPMENITKEKSGTSYIIAVPVAKGKGISIGKRYRLTVTGQDVKGNPITTRGNGYGFYLDANSVKPSLRVLQPQSSATVAYKGEENSLNISGTVYFSSEACDGGSVLIKDSTGNLEWLVGTYMDEKDENGNTIEATQKTDIEHNWAITLNFKKDNTSVLDADGKPLLPDGNHTLYVYAITGTDFANAENMVSVERNVKVDTLKPRQPQLVKITDKTDEKVYSATEWYNDKNLKVALDVADDQRSGYASGLNKTEYLAGSAATSDVWASLADASYGYINGLVDGENTVKFRSVDGVGNKSDITEVTIKVDTVAPEIKKAFIGENNADNNGWDELTAGNILNIKDSHKTQFKFEIEEARKKPVITVRVDGNLVAGAIQEETAADGKWTWVSNNEVSLTPDKEISVKITAEDGAHNDDEVEYKVLVDTTGPVITITSPDKDLEGADSLSSAYTLRAGISDAAGNVAQTKYLLTKTEYADNAAIKAAVLADGQEPANGKGSVSVSTESLNISKGKWYLYIYSKDEADNESLAKRAFWFDKKEPVVGVTTAPENKYIINLDSEQNINQIISISGSASDGEDSESNGIKKITYSYSTDNGATYSEPVDLNTDTSDSTSYTASTYDPDSDSWSAANWTISLPYGSNNTAAGALSDGNYKFVISATDNAGRVGSKEYDILIDTVKPRITLPTYGADEWFSSLKIDDMEIPADDDTSGISLVQYNTSDNAGYPDSGWIPFTYDDSTKKASGTLGFTASGIKTVYIKATDVAGNTEEGSFSIKVDADKPTLNPKYSQIGNAPIDNFGGTTYENGQSAMTFWGEYRDIAANAVATTDPYPVSGVKPLSLILTNGDVEKTLEGDGIQILYSVDVLPDTASDTMPTSFDSYEDVSDITKIRSWKAIIPGNKLETGTISIKGEDKAGNLVTAQKTTNLEHDRVSPKINNTNISVIDNSNTYTKAYRSAESSTVLEYFVNTSNVSNKTFTIKGSSTDEVGVASTVLKIGETSYPNSGTPGAWSFTLSLPESGPVEAKIITTDLAGNTNTDEEGNIQNKIIFNYDNTPPVKAAESVVSIEGNPYRLDLWGKSKVLSVSGVLTEAGSGASKVYYKRYETEAAALTGAETTGFISDYRSSKDGFIDIAANSSSYTGNLTSLVEGENYILLLAEDNVGNAQLISATSETTPYFLQIDTHDPVIKSTSGGTKYIGKEGNSLLSVTADCTDTNIDDAGNQKASGIKELKVTVTLGEGGPVKTAVVSEDENGTIYSGSWTANFNINKQDLENIEDGSEFDINALATDNAGCSTLFTLAKLKVDKNAPIVGLSSVSQIIDSANKALPKASENSSYMRPDKELIVKGFTRDDISPTVYTWLKLVPYTTSEGTPIPLDDTISTDGAWTLSLPADTLSAEGYNRAKLYACTRDLAGNVRESELQDLIFDVTGPVYKMEGIEEDFVPTKIDGKAYIYNPDAPDLKNWYGNTNLMIQGTWSDQAGVAEVYYERVSGDTTSIQDCEATEISAYPSFTVSKTQSGLYTFNTEIRDFTSGKNTLLMYGKDALGNISALGKLATVWVDTTSPTATTYTDASTNHEYKFSDIYYTNAQEKEEALKLKLYFYAEDEASGSGIDNSSKPIITIDNHNYENMAEYTSTDTEGKYLVTVTPDETIFTGKSGYIPLIVTIKDKAGNSKDVNIGTINVDEVPPEVELSNPKNAGSNSNDIQVNGIITIKGSAKDDNLSAQPLVSLEYTTTPNDSGSWKDLLTDEEYTFADGDITNAADFSVKIDTTKLRANGTAKFPEKNDFDEFLTYYIRASVKDEAGNIGLSNPEKCKFKINQDTDRPVVEFMDITLPEISATETKALLKLSSKKLRMTVTDDDEVDEVGVVLKQNDDDENPVTLENPDIKNDTWTYDLSNITDKTYKIIVKVKDKEERTKPDFESGTLASPKFTGGEKKIEKSGVALSLMLDNSAPVTRQNQFAFYEETSETLSADELTWANTAPALGGKRKYLALKVTAGDENKISGVNVKLDNVDVEEDKISKLSEETNPSADNKIDSIWFVKDIDVSALTLTEGEHKLEITIIDGAENKKNDIIGLSVDRTAPALGITSPKPNADDASSYSSGSIQAYGSISGATKLYYAVSPKGKNENDSYSPNGSTVTEWEKSDGTKGGDCTNAQMNPAYNPEISFTSNWTINFDSNLSATTGVHTYNVNDYLFRYGITTPDDVKNSSFTTPVKLYLWLKAVDEVGNETEASYPIIVNPQGDRPTIQFGKPENGATLGNTVSIYGTHSDTLGTVIGVKSVWVQLISKVHDNTETADDTRFDDNNIDADNNLKSFDFNWDDLSYMKAKGYKIYKIEDYDPDAASHIEWDETQTGNAKDYAALAKIDGLSWSLTINANKEFDYSSGKNPVGIRVFAKDGDGKLNTIQAERLIYFDSKTPQIKDLQLVQEDTVTTLSYKSGMYISSEKGAWKLIGNVEDDGIITSIEINGSEPTTGVTIQGTSASFEYPLSIEGQAGTISLTIEASDKTTATTGDKGIENITIRYDNKKPELVKTGTDYNIKQIIQQSNGFYKFNASVKEEPAADGTAQSGFAYTAFYFKRIWTENAETKTKLFDILGGKDKEVTTATLDSENNLYWYTLTVDERGETDDPSVLTLSSGDTSDIRVNSLVKIGGAFYKIKDKTNTQIKLNGNPPRDATELKIAAAGLIDNTTEEKTKDTVTPSDISTDGYYIADNLKYDDGDRMLEFVSKSGTTWNWSASVCSKNIPDGPVKLVYVVFDEAGNFDYDEVDCIICNNTPRIAGFTIRTDYNNNGSVEDVGIDAAITEYISSKHSASSVTSTNEDIKYYDPDTEKYGRNQPALSNKIEVKGKDANGNESTSIPVLTLRGKTVITPEFVGGNGKVSYYYTINSNSNISPVELLEGSTDYTIKSEDIIIQPADLVRFGNFDCGKFEFKFVDEMAVRDELEGTNYSFDSAQKEKVNAYLSVYMGIKTPATNATKPTVKIKPFYWNGLNNNSIYGSSEASVKSYKDLKGHIELEGDLPESFNNVVNEMDKDPKVSGKIVVTGSVHDDNLINSIAIKFASANNNFICSDGENGEKIAKTVANFENGHLEVTDNATLTDGGYQFIINEGSEKFDKDGHDVEWTLYLDTENFAKKADTDVELTVVASNLGAAGLATEATETSPAAKNIDGETAYKQLVYDASNASSTPGTVQTRNDAETAYYKMDIVPYITEVITSLSKYNKSYPSVYSRSALGRYPVYALGKNGNYTAEKIGITGFNLSGGTVNFAGTNNTPSWGNGEEITIPAGAKSGEVSVTVNGVSSLNNSNNNDSRGMYGKEKQEDGTYTDTITTIAAEGNYEKYNNYYNRIPNNRNNNNLTDDVYLNIWGFNSEAALAQDEGLVDNLEMKINPSNGLIGFAFSNGSTRFSMPAKDTSYTKWSRTYDYMKHNALAYDYNGNSYAVSVGGDINDDGGFDFFTFMSSRWGAVGGDNLNSNKGNDKHRNLDSIASKGVKAGRVRNKDRFQSQSIATNGNNIYLAYYDMMYSQIRFKAGTISDTVEDFGNFHHFEKNYDNAPDDEPYCQIIADGTADTFGGAGEYVSIGVMSYSTETNGTTVSNDVVAIVWYDGNNLQFAYGVNPLANVDTDGTAKNNKVKNGTAGWHSATSETTELISGGGEYCQLAVARDNSIHIAAYDSANSDLKYIYIPFNETDKVPNVAARIECSVDTYLDVGEQLTIDVAEDKDGNQIPYIGYFGAFPKLPRYAYLAEPDKFHDSQNAVTAGAISDYYTGVWECMLVPSQSNVKDSRKINVGVWKYNGTPTDNGKLAYSTTGTNHGKSVADGGTIGTSTAAANTGKCYGNGTDNGVLAYVVAPNSSKYCAESAQMK